MWLNGGCDIVTRLHQGRLTKGLKLPKSTVVEDNKKKNKNKKKTRKYPHDRLIMWDKPLVKPAGISQKDFDSLPGNLILRELHAYICIPGHRTKEIIVVTLFLDAIEYPSGDILDLYDERWGGKAVNQDSLKNKFIGYNQDLSVNEGCLDLGNLPQAEINLKQIKTTLGMDVLSCKTPEMIRKEVYTYLLAYNLLRTIMYRAGANIDRNPVRFSLQETRQHFNNFIPQLINKTKVKGQKIYKIMLEAVADSYQEIRVGRVEPRVKKRRPKAYPLMQEPRQILRSKMKAA